MGKIQRGAVWTAMLGLFLGAVLPEIGAAVSSGGQNIIFVVDTSGSMREEGLFDRVKERLKTMVRESKRGDNISVIAFDTETTEVIDRQINKPQDKADVMSAIDGLAATGAWTRMCHAFGKTMIVLERLRNQYPRHTFAIYLLTDAENDPPPDAPPDEKRSFVSCLGQHFRDFDSKDGFVYLLHYGDMSDDQKKNIEDGTRGHVKPISIQRPEPDPFPHIGVVASGLSFGELDTTKGNVTRGGVLTIESLSPGAKDSTLMLNLPPTSAFGPRFTVRPKRIV